MNIEELKHEIEHFNIESRSIELFWKTLEKYKNENSDEYERYFVNNEADKLFIGISSISLKLGNWPECDYNHIVVRIPIWHDNSYIGDYSVMFSFDGEVDDDMFNIF